MLELYHIGEALLANMLSESAAVRRYVVPQLGSNCKFQTEVNLQPVNDLIFDGTSRVDVAAVDQDASICVPIEAKLGNSRMSAGEFNKRFLQQLQTSHNDNRVKGSMVSVLERKFERIFSVDVPVSIRIEQRQARLSRDWVLVVRREVLNKWNHGGHPDLSAHCTVLTFEDIVSRYGGPTALNNLVRRKLPTDFYSEWDLL